MLTTGTNIDSLIKKDPRCRALARGLLQLSQFELAHLLDVLTTTPERIVVDSYNYDPSTGSWCPLAIGLGVPDTAEAQTVASNEEAKQLILKVGTQRRGRFSLNPVHGISGQFFRDDRHSELAELVKYIVENYADTDLCPAIDEDVRLVHTEASAAARSQACGNARPCVQTAANKAPLKVSPAPTTERTTVGATAG
jgi:hypothetical protein